MFQSNDVAQQWIMEKLVEKFSSISCLRVTIVNSTRLDEKLIHAYNSLIIPVISDLITEYYIKQVVNSMAKI